MINRNRKKARSPTQPVTREQVIAKIVAVMIEAEANADDPYDAATAAFPGVPGSVLGEAGAELIEQQERAFFESHGVVKSKPDRSDFGSGVARERHRRPTPARARSEDWLRNNFELDDDVPF